MARKNTQAYNHEDKKLIIAKELLVVMNMDAQLDAMASNIKNVQARQLQKLSIKPEAQPVIEAYLNETMKLLFATFKNQEVKEKYAQLYAATFKEKELEDILKFYQTETGKSFVEKFPSAMSGITKVAEQQLATIQPQMQQLQAQLQQDLEKFKLN